MTRRRTANWQPPRCLHCHKPILPPDVPVASPGYEDDEARSQGRIAYYVFHHLGCAAEHGRHSHTHPLPRDLTRRRRTSK